MRVGQTVSSTLPAEARQKPPPILRDPFNSTPTTAPTPWISLPEARALARAGSDRVQAARAEAVATDPDSAPEPPGPGPLERQLTAELAAMSMINPTAKTQSLLALQLARAADQLDPGDIKMMLTVGKELRSLLDGLNKAPRAGGDDDDDSSPFGAVRPEIQHPPAV